MLEVAINQAITGASTIQRLVDKGLDTLVIELKEKEGDTPVTIIDREAARDMIECVFSQLPAQPSFLLIDEELGFHGDQDASVVGYQDSCDGTSNLMFDPDRILPVAGATWVQNGQTEICAVADPKLNKLLFSQKGAGAFVCDLVHLSLSDPVALQPVEAKPKAKSIVMFDALLNAYTREAAGKMLTACGYHAQNMRTYASCLLHLWMLAKGQAQIVMIDAMSGFWDVGLHLACQQVGCKVTDLNGTDITGPSSERYGQYPFLLGTAPGVNHGELLDAAQKSFGIGYKGFRGPNYGV
jgi:fructose-1,6-bisphosphatase/inositol monophosphatase family enzyme